MSKLKIPVSERAVLARIRRYLARDCRYMKKNRRWPYAENLPEWIIANERSHIVDGFDDPEEFAREHGLLKPYEFMEKA
jgi:uncharacterized protein (UPF0305 family)